MSENNNRKFTTAVVTKSLKGYVPISCEGCKSRDNLEFGTEDGANQGSQIFCPTCISGWKDYCARRYPAYYDECFLGAAYCRYCESYDDLYVSEDVVGYTEQAEHVRCRSCVEEELAEEAAEAEYEAKMAAQEAEEKAKRAVAEAEKDAQSAVEEAEKAATDAEDAARRARETAEKAKEAIEKAKSLKSSEIKVTLEE